MKKILLPVLVVALAVLTAIPVLPAQAAPADGGLPTVTWLPPLSNQGEFQLKDGSTLPIKFTLTDPDTGAFVEDTGVRVDVNEVLFRDDFNDGDAEGWTEVNYSGSGAVFEVENGEYSLDSTTGGVVAIAHQTDFSWTDYIVEVNVKKISGSNWPDIFVRYQDLNNFYYVQMTSSGLLLRERVGGTYSQIASWSGSLDLSVWHKVKIAIEGEWIRVYLDGQLKITATDSSFATGTAGLGAWNSHVHFDDVMVLSLLATKTFNYGEGSDNVRISYDTVFADNFDDGNYDGWAPAVADDTSWSVEDGVLRCTPEVSYPRILADETMGYTDYVFEADARLISGLGYALLFRATDHNNFYSFQYDPGLGFKLRLYQFTNFPNGEDVAPPVSYSIDYEWHHLKVAVLGNNIKCYVDGYLVFDVDDTVLPAPLTGGIGFRMWAGGEAEFDNVTVQVPHYIANLHTKESGMTTGEYLITVWSGSGDQLGTYLFDLTDAIQGMGRGKGKA